MIVKTGKDFDVIIISAEYYDDHPLSPAGIIARVLDSKGYTVGIIEKPETKQDFLRLRSPRLCFCVVTGSMDSMVHNFTPLKKERIKDAHSRISRIPNRALLFYCNKIKQYHKGSIIIIGGIEASLRRFAHYDFWDNNLRRSILLDSRADILVYGNGEIQLIEIMHRLRQGKELLGINGTCIVSKTHDDSFIDLPSFELVKENKKKFCEMQRLCSNDVNLAQEYTNNYVLQFSYPPYSSKDLDWVYSLSFSRKMHPSSHLKMAQFSVVTHRGCIGACHFCALSLHQGSRIISRSEESILSEITNLTKHPKFKGYIDDLGGPSANMYRMECKKKHRDCNNDCIHCAYLDTSHIHLINLLKKARSIPGVKKVFVRSGIRFDLAFKNPFYLQELSKYHISGGLKIAPEHCSHSVLEAMNKDNNVLDTFINLFHQFNESKRQYLQYYFMIGHPGESPNETKQLVQMIKKKKLENVHQFQLFTPTPMTVSTCMYWTGYNPFTMDKIFCVHDYHTKKIMKKLMLVTILEKNKKGKKASGNKQNDIMSM